MRPDLWFWLGAAVVVLIAGGLRILPHLGDDPRRARLFALSAPLALACLGLVFLTAGLVWRARFADAWLGSTPADGIAMLAFGSLVILAWILFSDGRRARIAAITLGRGRAMAEALGIFGTGLVILLAIGAAWRNPWPDYSAPADWWLFGARIMVVSVGLGAWLPALADAAWGLRRTDGPGAPGESTIPVGLEAMRTGYPWLTAAWLLGAAWSLVTVAALWRGVATESWLTAAWLLGGAYLICASRSVRGLQWALVLLAASGTAVALLVAWQAPLLLP
jgi:hypothetical protein